MLDERKILVTGATGNIGGAVLRSLLDKGFSVRAGSTNPDNAAFSSEVEKTKLVYRETDTVTAALEEVAGVYLIAPPMDPFAHEVLIPFIDEARDAGVEHIILNSSFGVELEDDDALRITEKHLMNSGVNYTIFRPNFVMENFSTGFISPMLETGRILLAAADARTSFISCEDIGAAAARAFRHKLYGREFNLSGPEAIDHADVARMISEYSGKDIQYQAISEDDMLDGARAQGMPEASVQMLGGLYHLTRQGVMARVFDDVETITGVAPQTFARFAAGVNW
ncbi:NAD(P)H-binding protein [Roseibium sp. SCP14]|uniref:NAD(P)H-binding protein n=1 Tax=Roseibium sp. SCP14 TaxID=3141375 RepID=UPI00333DB89F